MTSTETIFGEFEDQGWNTDTKFQLLSNYLDEQPQRVRDMFQEVLQEVADEENAYSEKI